MIPPFLLSQSDKIYAALASIGVLLGGEWFVAASDETGFSKYGAIGCVAVCASVATAFIKTRATTIKARAEAAASNASTLEAATTALIKRITDANDKREAQLGKDLDYARNRADTQEEIAQANNEGKHNAIEQLFSVMLHARNLEEMLREHGVTVPEGPKVDLGKVVKSQDAKTSALLSSRTDASKKATVRVELPQALILRPIHRPEPKTDNPATE